MIELTEMADEETRREIFDRLNTGGTKLVPMEQRRGSLDGKFLTFIQGCAKKPLFRELCPVSRVREDRAEYIELALRYFAYIEKYLDFQKSVEEFLNEFLANGNNGFEEERLRNEFEEMLVFVKTYFPDGFRKNEKNTSVPRIRFEAISVGVTLARRINPNLVPEDPTSWLHSKEFIRHTRSDASNSKPRVRNRIHFVRDNLLGVAPEEEDEE